MDHSVHSDVNTTSREIEERLPVYEEEQEEERTLQPPAESPSVSDDDPSRAPVIKEIIKTPPRRLRLMLNEAQAKSVTHPLASQLQILAGPGTGKTKTLISRVMYLLSQNVHPSDMIITTFTVKAANEMRERLAEMIGPSVANRLILGTFHSISRKYLHKYGHLIGIPSGFTIADDSDSLHYVKDLCKDMGFKEGRTEARRVRDLISKAKAHGYFPDSPGVTAEINGIELEVYKKYQEKLQDSKTLDFDDLLLQCVKLLQRFPKVVSNIQAVLVDEYQDTNSVQYNLMKLFAKERENITIVGDPDQSIYGFRAALATNLSLMAEDFPATTIISLEENYRSSGHILDAALTVIQQDTERIKKEVRPNHDMGAKPSYISVMDTTAEARLIAEEVERLLTLSCGILKPADFVVLVRTGFAMKPIEAALTRVGIDYRVVGGSRFWDREEIKLVLSYLHLIKNRRSQSLLNIINSPRRGIGGMAMVALLGHANAHEVPLWDAIVLATQGELKEENRSAAGEYDKAFAGEAGV
ncbi:P-loop containing nucleoside triphosphate hydrolase protein [Myxozyma melibiosi]|uniref:DNA 3'-5' helicase n=1 Tax=Myxozyma melibiosi TaxID=54550 RepID=A0ABR1EY41_9ASCO